MIHPNLWTQLYASTLTYCALIALIAGCGAQAERQSVIIFERPSALDKHVVWIDQNNNRALLLDVSKKFPSPDVTSFAVPENPVTLVRRNDHNELLLLARGKASGDGVLSVLTPKGVDREFPLGSRFDTISQSADGRYAFARYSAGNEDTDSLLFNPNEVALIDLDADGSDGVTLRSLRGFGAAPRKVEFSPEMEVAGVNRRLAVVLFDSHMSLLDLSHPGRPEYTIEFSRDANIGLQQVRFSPDEKKIYLAGAQSNDIYVLTLTPSNENRVNDFEPSLNQLGAGARPSDMVIYEQDGNTRLLSVSGNQALVIESGSNRITSIPLQNPASQILLYEGRAPFDDEIEQRALLYSTGSSTLTFLDLDQVEERTTRNLETLRLSGAISLVTPLEDNLVLLMRSNGLGMLNLEGRSASELSSQANLDAAIPTLELNRLWIRPQGLPALAYLDFSNERSTPGQVSLDAPAIDLLMFTDMERQRVVVTHASTGGAVTILDAKNPSNAQDSVTLRGFFYANVLGEDL